MKRRGKYLSLIMILVGFLWFSAIASNIQAAQSPQPVPAKAAHGPAGAITGATPDGRCAGETLADGTHSAVQGRDRNGPLALLKSAMTINQTPFQSSLLNMKFHPSALATREDLEKLSSMIKTYFSYGGKHIQFNVVGRDTLLSAQKAPDNHRDLIVRVAGFSTYFVRLTKTIQDDIIARTEYDKTA